MKIDPESWVLATGAAGLLLAGGAFLRAAFRVPLVPTSTASASAPPELKTTRAQGAQVSDAEVSELREQLASANATKEAQRAEMVEQRQRSERQVQGAQAEIQRLAGELDAERTRAQAATDAHDALRERIAVLDQENRASATDAKALASLSGEVAELQRKLMAVTEERDKIRAKTEALERLIEGVRARSRELAEQVKVLKGEPT